MLLMMRPLCDDAMYTRLQCTHRHSSLCVEHLRSSRRRTILITMNKMNIYLEPREDCSTHQDHLQKNNNNCKMVINYVRTWGCQEIICIVRIIMLAD